MIDPTISMAISVQARKGVYAVLLGSGVSRPAGIPTGWEVVEDLIRRVAKLQHEPEPADPAQWYEATTGSAPSYSTLLAGIARSRADRAQLLRSYFEPDEDERDAGQKLPTKAHRAIARLVRDGYIRVIVTTNFDRLMEHALHEESISPKVISNRDTERGSSPLQHADCTIIKVNGDYLDLQTRNTSDELAKYDKATNALLDRIFSEYGLIIAGWSGDWDAALRSAIIRNTRHRFATFWLAHSKPGELGRQIIENRDAEVISIETADEAFEDLEQKIISLEEGRTAHPLSREVALATAKRLLSEPRHFIKLEDLLMKETSRLQNALRGDDFDVSAPEPDAESIRARADRAEAVSANLAAILMAGCYWGDEDHYRLWRNCLEACCTFPANRGMSYRMWTSMQYLPATLILYHAGIACLASEQWATLRYLLTECFATDSNGLRRLVLHFACARNAFPHDAANMFFPTKEPHKTPASDWLHERLRVTVGQFVSGEPRYSDLFNRFELLAGMTFYHQNQIGDNPSGRSNWMPDGRYIWHDFKPGNVLDVFREEIDRDKDYWPPLQVGFFSGLPATALETIDAVEQCWQKQRF